MGHSGSAAARNRIEQDPRAVARPAGRAASDYLSIAASVRTDHADGQHRPVTGLRVQDRCAVRRPLQRLAAQVRAERRVSDLERAAGHWRDDDLLWVALPYGHGTAVRRP